MRTSFCILVTALLPACAPAAFNAEPLSASDSARATPRYVAPLSAAAARILVTPEHGLGKNLDVLAVLDFHTRATSEDKGFDELRARTVALGADAVISADFEHGEGDEPSHLSGMAVRYAKWDQRPFDVLGKLDVATPEDADDKGYDKLLAQARQLGADQVRGIEFDHGREGGMSHLRGVAVRHRSD